METTVDRRHEIDLGQLHDAILKLRDGDFSARLPADWTNRAGTVARVFNSLVTMLEQLSAEQIRVTNEIGTLGELGCQAEVFGVYGSWRQMLDGLNRMAVGWTVEMRRTSQFAQAAAAGQNPAPLKSEFIGREIAQMQEHINAMASKLAQKSD